MTTAKAPVDLGSASIPEVTTSQTDTSMARLESFLDELKKQRPEWVKKSPRELITLIDQLMADFSNATETWIAASIQAKQIVPGSARESEEWLGGPFIVLRNLRFLRKTLAEIEQQGHPKLPGVRFWGERLAVRAMPYEIYDRFFFPGIRADVWMQPGIKPDNLKDHVARAYRQSPSARTCLVLGAGNVSSIAPLDVFYKLFVEKQVVILKMNPVNDYLGPIFEQGFRCLIEAGVLRIAYGGVTVGQALCRHDLVDEIHVTGSDKTFDAIVWGAGTEGEARKRRREPVIDKPITSELGNVSPVVVVPGPWSRGDLQYQATKLASMLANNAGFNCNATRVIVNHSKWALRPELLRRIRSVFAQLPARHAYYPGASDRYQQFVDAHPEAVRLGSAAAGELPWTIIEGVDSEAKDDIVFRAEAFCSVFAETTIDAPDTVSYIERATAFLNDRVWGSLNACLIVHPKTARDPQVKKALERAIEQLRYGTISINLWPALGYALGTTPWGAFPGHESHDVQSGQGIVHNTMMFDAPEKSVIRGPFKIWPVAPWFVSHPNPLPLAKQLTKFQTNPSFLGVLKVLGAALLAPWLKR